MSYMQVESYTMPYIYHIYIWCLSFLIFLITEIGYHILFVYIGSNLTKLTSAFCCNPCWCQKLQYPASNKLGVTSLSLSYIGRVPKRSKGSRGYFGHPSVRSSDYRLDLKLRISVCISFSVSSWIDWKGSIRTAMMWKEHGYFESIDTTSWLHVYKTSYLDMSVNTNF